jgi:hypothetical protein
VKTPNRLEQVAALGVCPPRERREGLELPGFLLGNCRSKLPPPMSARRGTSEGSAFEGEDGAPREVETSVVGAVGRRLVERHHVSSSARGCRTSWTRWSAAVVDDFGQRLATEGWVRFGATNAS